MAIQPAQADQPGSEIITGTEKATDTSTRGLWKSLLIWGGIVIGILTMAAVAPLCHYGGGRFRPPTLFTFSNVTAPPMVQRLVGEFSPIFDLTIFFSFFPAKKVDLKEDHVNNYTLRP